MSAPPAPNNIIEAIARQMHASHEALMARDYHEGHTPSTYEQHAGMWLARSAQYAQAVWEALLAEGQLQRITSGRYYPYEGGYTGQPVLVVPLPGAPQHNTHA